MRAFTGFCIAALLAGPVVRVSAAPKDELPHSLQKASDVIGKKVETPSGENLGKIEEVVLDASNGRIAYAVLSFGGFLGIGDKLFAIPWQALKENREKQVYNLSADKEYLKDAPGFDKKNWPDMGDVAWRREVYQFYKIPFSESDASSQLALSEVKRESVQLPLTLRQGLTLAYDVSCKEAGQNKNIRLQVLSMAGDEATVEATCSGKDAEKSTPCTFTVAKDGTVRAKDDARPQTQPAPGTKEGSAKEKEMALLFVQHVFGQGLHRDKLEPGREYMMPGSFHSFHEGSAHPGTAREVGTPRPQGTPETARPVPSAATTGTHAMRFDGTSNCNGQSVAVFSISHGKTTGAPERSPTARPEDRPGVARAGEACAGCSGKAAYRTSDGLLEAMAFEGASVRRADSGKPGLGN